MFPARLDESDEPERWRGAQVDSNGQFTLPGLAPGKYRIVATDNGDPPPEDSGQEVTVREGETATIEIKPEIQP